MSTVKETKVKIDTSRDNFVADKLAARKIGEQVVNLTKTKAAQFLDYKVFGGERPIREDHVQHLYDEWQAGRFDWNLVNLVIARLTTKDPTGQNPPRTDVYRLNGQHTCWFRFLIPDRIDPARCPVRELVYEVRDEDELRMLYSIIDRNAPRTNAHITRALMGNAASTLGVGSSYIGYLTAGLRVWQWENLRDRNKKGTPQEVAAMASGKYSPLFALVGAYVQKYFGKAAFVKRSAIIAAMFATFEKAPEEAPKFWTPVIDCLGFDSDSDPRYLLSQFIIQHGHSMNQRGSGVDPESMYRVSINLWNKWRRKEKLTMVRYPESRPIPV